MSVFVGAERGFRALGGLLGGFAADARDSVSEDVSGGVGRDCCIFFCFRASRLFKPERRLIASLLRYSVAGMFCGSATKAVGLATCARVGAFDMAVENEGLALRLEKSKETLLIAGVRRLCL